jgi:hypothetical protein
MSKKEPQIIGKIIATRIREIDHSRVNVTNTMTLEESIEHIKDMWEFEEDKTLMNKMIEEVINNWDEDK